MTLSKHGRNRVYTFPSFEAYLDRAANPVWKHDFRGESKWGTSTFETVLHNARNGWQKSLGDIEQWVGMLVGDISTQIPKPNLQFDRVGSMWDLGRVLEGDPEHWVYEEPSQDIDRHGRGNLVRLVINTAASFGTFEKSHKHRCGAVLALTQLLEMCGLHVQFEITTAIRVPSCLLEFRTVAKAAGESLNLACVSFWCSKEMERHIDFAICETMTECKEGGSTCYGSVAATTDRGDICFDSMSGKDCNWADASSVRRYVIAELHKQGITLGTTL